MADEFSRKVALVTGGASGIGEAVAFQLGAQGASVVIADLQETAAKRVTRSDGSGDRMRSPTS